MTDGELALVGGFREGSAGANDGEGDGLQSMSIPWKENGAN